MSLRADLPDFVCMARALAKEEAKVAMDRKRNREADHILEDSVR